MEIDAFGKYDMLGGKRDLEKTFKSNDFTLFYSLEHEDGLFKKNDRCMFQCKLTPNGRLYTGIAHNWGVFDKRSGLRFAAPIFSDFKACFNSGLPNEVMKKFPYLKILLEHSRINSSSIFEIDSVRDYGLSFETNYDIPLFETWPIATIKDDALPQKLINSIREVVSFIDNAVNEYSLYKKTRLFKIIEPNIGSIKKKLETGSSIYMIYRIAKLAYSFYSGTSFGDGDADINADIDISSFENMSAEDMADYLCETDFDISDSQSDISFTGNGDKYSDNDYNRQSADDFLKQEAYYREKGDNAAADAAHRQAMKHKGRIND